MLEGLIAGKIDSWAIVWYLSVFMRQGLTLFPIRSLVGNIGFDGSGTNCGTDRSPIYEAVENFRVLTYPKKVRESSHKKDVFNAISQNNKYSLLRKFKKRLYMAIKMLK